MSVTEDLPQVAPPPPPAGPQPGTRPVLLVWDAPNLDMGLGSIIGGRPTAAHRPRFDALGRWLLARTADLSRTLADAGADDGPAVLEPEATVFTNIAPGSADVVRPWVEALRNVGFAVFAKPKIDEDSDVDSDMLAHIALRRREGLAAVLVASADGQAFRQPLEDIARDGIPVQVLGFREHASWALASETLEFVDLEDIPGVFREPLPRIGLDSLPDEGAWLQPFRPLSALLASRV
ncbi:NYN domain-containing protein [Mycolicibacterium sp. S2-37]|uniref:NYN domain-containing protein n=1 Tax=Mycolicibacterium sp. S2-37 TaxID=2810297 RepID=UPI001A950FBF|nr:NYN domain-containing protein [Mycolicibacterium sp. S2-37]MBO0678509.1 NYN domain-containing protein [Mycolicibacterium sp. S2-37]